MRRNAASRPRRVTREPICFHEFHYRRSQLIEMACNTDRETVGRSAVISPFNFPRRPCLLTLPAGRNNDTFPALSWILNWKTKSSPRKKTNQTTAAVRPSPRSTTIESIIPCNATPCLRITVSPLRFRLEGTAIHRSSSLSITCHFPTADPIRSVVSTGVSATDCACVGVWPRHGVRVWKFVYAPVT